MLLTMFGMIMAMESTSHRRNREIEINTPGNFKKCPKGAEEFSFMYRKEDNYGAFFTCYARTKKKAEEKFQNFLKENNYVESK